MSESHKGCVSTLEKETTHRRQVEREVPVRCSEGAAAAAALQVGLLEQHVVDNYVEHCGTTRQRNAQAPHAPGARTAQHDGEDQRRQHQAAVGFPAAREDQPRQCGRKSASLRHGTRTSSSSGTAHSSAAGRPPAWRKWRRGRAAAEGPWRPRWRRGRGVSNPAPHATAVALRRSRWRAPRRGARAQRRAGGAAQHCVARGCGRLQATGGDGRGVSTAARQRGGRVARGAAERVQARAGAAAAAAAPQTHFLRTASRAVA
jgi:hypothetical protein